MSYNSPDEQSRQQQQSNAPMFLTNPTQLILPDKHIDAADCQVAETLEEDYDKTGSLNSDMNK